MQWNFPTCLTHTLAHEGGFVDHPRDPGGATNFGITQKTYDAFRRRNRVVQRTVRAINEKEYTAIYREDYWSPIKGDKLPAGIDYVTFDAAVNSGVTRGAKWTQKALGVKVDGHIGAQSVSAALAIENAGREYVCEVIKSACAYRMGFLKGLSHWSTFGRGWTRRVLGVEAGALAMVASPQYIAEEGRKSMRSAKEESTVGVGGGSVAGLGVEQLPDYASYAGWVVLIVVAILIGRRVMAERDRAKIMNDTAEQLILSANSVGTIEDRKD